jgi:hypothetical protein
MVDRRILKWPLWDLSQPSFDELVAIDAYPSLGVDHVSMQSSVLTLWSLGDLNCAKIKRRFRIVETGQSTEPTGNYLGSVHERVFVWHVFEIF